MSGQRIAVLIHLEDGVWWAESPDVPGLSAAADVLGDTRELVRRALDELLGQDCYVVDELEAVPRPA